MLNETVSYSYDTLNRLSTAQATNNVWGQAFTYDGFGNLTGASVTVGSAPNFSTSFEGNNHQAGTTYDANGNPITWYGGYQNSYASWDVENRMVSTTVNGGPTLYSYDPSGKRVAQAQVVSGTLQNIQVYFYAITGQRLATYQLSADATTFNLVSRNLYFGGKLIRSAGKTVATDRLGSVRASVTVNGGNLESFSYWPYGQERTSTADGREKFGTYIRDGPGQDYADQRYFNATMGRFWTPDPSGMNSADFANPVATNMYSYANSDPINHSDPKGLQCVDGGGVWVDDGTDPPCSFVGETVPTYTFSVDVVDEPDDDSDPVPLLPTLDRGLRPASPITRQSAVIWMRNGSRQLMTFATKKAPCLDDLKKFGLTPSDVQKLAQSVPLSHLVNLSRLPASAQAQFTEGMDMTALVGPGGNYIVYDMNNFWQGTTFQMLGTLLHELIHLDNMTQNSDQYIADKLGVTITSTDTSQISLKLTKDCF
jgi:RHS repeat-associated protein